MKKSTHRIRLTKEDFLKNFLPQSKKRGDTFSQYTNRQLTLKWNVIKVDISSWTAAIKSKTKSLIINAWNLTHIGCTILSCTILCWKELYIFWWYLPTDRRKSSDLIKIYRNHLKMNKKQVPKELKRTWFSQIFCAAGKNLEKQVKKERFFFGAPSPFKTSINWRKGALRKILGSVSQQFKGGTSGVLMYSWL